MPSKNRNYRQEYDRYHSTEKAKKQRARNNAARNKAEKEGRVSKGDGKDVAHSKPGARGSTSIQSASQNRSFDRNEDAKRKKTPRKNVKHG
jgi:hypothetical protein